MTLDRKRREVLEYGECAHGIETLANHGAPNAVQDLEIDQMRRV